MKILFQILFYFLLVTQINFAQAHKQIYEPNSEIIYGTTERNDNIFPIFDKNIQALQSDRYLFSELEHNLQIGIDKLDERGISNPFQTERFYPISHRTTPPSANKFVFPSSQISVIDTAFVISEQDTMRHLYSFNTSAKMTTDLIQKLTNGFWIDTVRRTYTYDVSNNMLSELLEDWENSQWMIKRRWEYTYDANKNILSSLSEHWENGQLVESYRYTYTYDANNNILSSLSEHWENGQLDYKYWYIYTYDENNNMLTSLYEYWNNGQLNHSFRRTCTYDVNNNRLSDLGESLENGQWVNNTRHTYTYDVNNNRLSSLYEIWFNNQWVYNVRNTYTYDMNNNMLSLHEEWWAQGQLESIFKFTYTYDANNNMLTSYSEQWIYGQLEHSNRCTYNYDANNNMLTCLSEELLNGQWVYFWRHTCTYDANNNMLTDLWEEWWEQSTRSFLTTYTYDVNNNILSELSESWDWGLIYSGEMFTYTYDTQNNMTSILHYVWEDSSWIPTNTNYGFFGFSLNDSAGNEYLFFEPWYNITLIRRLILTGVESNYNGVAENYSLSQNYPNPFNPSTTIKYSIPKLSFVTIKIYDVLGSEVATLVNEEKSVGTYEVTWDASGFSGGVSAKGGYASGVYLYRLQAGNYVETKKMILIK